MSTVVDVAKTFAAGATLGVVFAVFGLPVPAPNVIAGAAGVVGVTVGYIVVTRIRG